MISISNASRVVTTYDYFDVMEKTVADGRVTEAEIDEACRRVLHLVRKHCKPFLNAITEKDSSPFDCYLFYLCL